MMRAEILLVVFREGCRAGERDTGLAHWSQVSGDFDRRLSQDSKGVSELHPVPFRIFRGERGEAAFLLCGEGMVHPLAGQRFEALLLAGAAAG
jgi:hypothetical protein